MKSNHQVFKTLDNSPRILFWKMDEFAVMVLPVFLAIAFSNLWLILAVFLKGPYSKIKKRYSRYSLHHSLYWHFPTSYLKHLKTVPPSHERTLLL